LCIERRNRPRRLNYRSGFGSQRRRQTRDIASQAEVIRGGNVDRASRDGLRHGETQTALHIDRRGCYWNVRSRIRSTGNQRTARRHQYGVARGPDRPGGSQGDGAVAASRDPEIVGV